MGFFMTKACQSLTGGLFFEDMIDASWNKKFVRTGWKTDCLGRV
jgi:hypothetical protein